MPITHETVFNHYACIFVDVDLKREFHKEFMVEREGLSWGWSMKNCQNYVAFATQLTMMLPRAKNKQVVGI